MVRYLLLLALVALTAPAAFGQGFNSPPPPTPGPFLPRYQAPVMPWGYGSGLSVGWAMPGVYGRLSIGGTTLGVPYYYPYSPYYAVPQVMVEPQVLPPVTAPPLQGAGGAGVPAARPELSAELALEFPVPVTLTLNGATLAGAEATRVLKSPPLKPGEQHTFRVAAKWTIDGQKFEWDREVTLGTGERSRIAVTRGFPVKD